VFAHVPEAPATCPLSLIQKPMLTVPPAHEPYNQLTEADTGGEYSVGPFAFRAGYAAPVQGPDTRLSAMDHFRGGLD
jgi:hypothetical protein